MDRLASMSPAAMIAHGAAALSLAGVSYEYFIGQEQKPGRYYYTGMLPLSYLVLYAAYHVGGNKAMVATAVTWVMAAGSRKADGTAAAAAAQR